MADGTVVPVGVCRLPLGSDQLGWMNEATALLAQGAAAVQRQLDEDGYILLRSLIDPAKVQRGLAKITSTLAGSGFFVPGSDPLDRQLALGDDNVKRRTPYDNYELMHCPEVLDVLESEELHDFFAMLWGEESRSFDNKWFRASGPGSYSGFHSAPRTHLPASPACGRSHLVCGTVNSG